mmetsp:Transcript_10690/g.29648  ORF Transcript_10690/g.29648 Transcript_10690/m.29648 type:complete len:362 (+) Transcript_10690:280-1365(+)
MAAASVLRLEVRALVEFNAQSLCKRLLGAEEAHGEEANVCLDHAGTALDLLETRPPAVGGEGPSHVDNLQTNEITVLVADETLGQDVIDARILTILFGCLGVAIVNLEYTRIVWPRVARGPRLARLAQKLQVNDAFRPVADGSADAIGPRVPAADDNYPLSFRRDEVAVRMVRVQQTLGIGRQELHGEVDAVQSPAVDGEVPRLGGACGQNNGIRFGFEGLDVDHFTDGGVRHKLDSLSGHQVNPPLDDLILAGLHVGHSIHHQPANAIGALEDCHGMSHFIELIGCGHARGPTADDGNAPSRPHRRRVGRDPALLKGLIDDGNLHGLDCHRVLVDSKDARSLARRRADAPGELREVVRGE